MNSKTEVERNVILFHVHNMMKRRLWFPSSNGNLNILPTDKGWAIYCYHDSNEMGIIGFFPRILSHKKKLTKHLLDLNAP